MEFVKRNLGEPYTTDALEESEQLVSPISIPRVREPRDMVYNGTIGTAPGEAAISDGTSSDRSKKQQKRKVSPFTIILILFGVAITSVLYIGNILVVGRLMSQINQLQVKHRQIGNQQELLKAQINKLSNIERIQQLAHDQLGLQHTKQLPVWMEIDPEEINRVEEAVEQISESK
jgi:cell division protein FtsL